MSDEPPTPTRVDAETAWEIQQVLALEGHILDSHAWDQLGEVFAPVVTVETEDEPLHGLELLETALRGEADLTATAPLSHHLVNTVLEPTPDGVRAWSRVLLVSNDQHTSTLDQVDHLQHGPSGWRVVHRRVRPRRPTPAEPPETFDSWRRG